MTQAKHDEPEHRAVIPTATTPKSEGEAVDTRVLNPDPPVKTIADEQRERSAAYEASLVPPPDARHAPPPEPHTSKK